jgi:hypothetical protein
MKINKTQKRIVGVYLFAVCSWIGFLPKRLSDFILYIILLTVVCSVLIFLAKDKR